MGPETEKRAPGALNFKRNWWRPITIGLVTLSSAVYNEKEQQFNHQLPIVQSGHTRVLEEGHLNSSLNDSGVIWTNPEISPPPPFENIPTAQNTPFEPLTMETAQSDISTTPKEYITIASLDVKRVVETGLSRITGYYCKQIPGYFIGDGGGFCGNTASGKPVRLGVAACGNKWALGTKLHVEGYGTVECQDRGHLADSQVDIWFSTNKDMAESGKPEWAQVTVVEE